MAWPEWPWPPDFTTDLRHCCSFRLRMNVYVGVQVKLWNLLRTRVTPERFCGGDSLRRGAIKCMYSLRTFTLTDRPPVSSSSHHLQHCCDYKTADCKTYYTEPRWYHCRKYIISFIWWPSNSIGWPTVTAVATCSGTPGSVSTWLVRRTTTCCWTTSGLAN